MYSLLFEVITGRFYYISSHLAHEQPLRINFGIQSSLYKCKLNSNYVLFVYLEVQQKPDLKFIDFFPFFFFF